MKYRTNINIVYLQYGININMESLLEFQGNLLRQIINNFRRYLHKQINWNQRMILKQYQETKPLSGYLGFYIKLCQCEDYSLRS